MMKKTIAAMAVAAALRGQGAPASMSPDKYFKSAVFSSRGECQRALNEMRNENRRSGDMGWYTTGDGYNNYVITYFDCVQLDRNVWVVIRTR